MYRPHNSEFNSIAIDFDGTLVDSDKAHLDARLMAYEQLAVELDAPSLARISPEIHAEGHHHGSNPLDINTWVIEQSSILIEGVDLPAEIVVRKKANYLELAQQGLEPRPGAVEFVAAALCRWQDNTFIATTAHLEEVEPFLNINGLASSFSGRQLITAESVKNLKPHPEAYEKTLQRAGLKNRKHRLLAVEDSPRGVQAAKTVGATVVGLLTLDYHRELTTSREVSTKPHVLVSSFAELSSMLDI